MSREFLLSTHTCGTLLWREKRRNGGGISQTRSQGWRTRPRQESHRETAQGIRQQGRQSSLVETEEGEVTITAKNCPKCGGRVVFLCFTLDTEGYLHDFVCKECGHMFDREMRKEGEVSDRPNFALTPVTTERRSGMPFTEWTRRVSSNPRREQEDNLRSTNSFKEFGWRLVTGQGEVIATHLHAGVVELAYTPDLDSGGDLRERTMWVRIPPSASRSNLPLAQVIVQRLVYGVVVQFEFSNCTTTVYGVSTVYLRRRVHREDALDLRGLPHCDAQVDVCHSPDVL